MRGKLLAVRREMARRMHQPIPEQGHWLARVPRGHYNYYAAPDNIEALRAFREADPALAADATAAQSEKPDDLAADGPPR